MCCPLACFCGVIRTRYVDSSFTFSLDYFAIILIGFSVSVCYHIIAIRLCRVHN